ncbi:hypothetical protein GTY86_31880 [Streptomyces sp. SID5770]|uniref:hypothetical protein n=1 Tax=Streptomyces sp. SID5770 TaxID=2690308 RepID=UPI00136D63BD|nr:hypothetical protein [Streptomyces sp. SID5770]MZE55796.1 hypothetical protein [Streptomyces sp. SID5770]
MSKLFLTLHVLVAVLAVGPVTVAASLFPRSVRNSLNGWSNQAPEARLLHRLTRVYAAIGAGVPLLGIATAAAMGVTRDPWVIASLTLTAIAAGLLITRILPGQQEALALLNEDGRRTAAAPDAPAAADTARESAALLKQLSMTTGIFSLLWAVVLVLMILRPGSSTGG